MMIESSYVQEVSSQAISTLRVANFLSPLLQNTYDAIAAALSSALDLPVATGVGESLHEFADGRADIGFLCGLQYVRAQRQRPGELELLAAPVLCGPRYQQQPIYFSDVIVRADSPYRSLTDLKGETWAYNEEASHSGYNLVYASLVERDLALPYFGKTLRSGAHLNSLQMVLNGEAAAAAIDSHILDVLLRRDAGIARQLRIIDAFGPSAIPPVVAAARLEPELKQSLRRALLSLHQDRVVAQHLLSGSIRRFVAVEDARYNDIRAMLATTEAHRSRIR